MLGGASKCWGGAPPRKSASASQAFADSGETFFPKRACTTSPSSIHIPKDIVKKMGPLADRVGVSDMQLTALTAGMINHSGGDVADISLSKSTTRRIRATAREVGAAKVKKDFSCQNGQINFDGKLLTDLGCFGKVNRLAVVVAQEEEIQLLCVQRCRSVFNIGGYNSAFLPFYRDFEILGGGIFRQETDVFYKIYCKSHYSVNKL